MTPEEAGRLADEWESLRVRRLEADKIAEDLKRAETQAHEKLIQWLLEQKLTAVGGQNIRVGLEKKVKPVAKDWDLIYGYILEHKDFSLLHRRLTEATVQEHWDLGEKIPGVDEFPVYKLSRSRVK